MEERRGRVVEEEGEVVATRRVVVVREEVAGAPGQGPTIQGLVEAFHTGQEIQVAGELELQKD